MSESDSIDIPTAEIAKMSLSCAGDILSLQVGDKVLKARIPKGERGPAGRDGISIRGDKGEKGETGAAGRDSTVAGPKGEKGDKGDMGLPAPVPKFTIGSVVAGEQPNVVIAGTPEEPVLHFVLPRGERGLVGPRGIDGKHGNHEFIQLQYAGNCPRFSNDFLAAHVVADGVVELPEMKESDIGSWIHFKTFDKLTVTGLVEEAVHLDKAGAKFVVIGYGGKFMFTKF